MRTLFFGSDSFAVAPLEALCSGRHEVSAVVGKPDRPSGRGLTPGSTVLVERARELGLTLIQPSSLRDQGFIDHIKEIGPDAGVVAGYGEMIPRWLLDLPPKGFINLHPSLLPRYRGAAPVERAIMEGASITGVTVIIMNERLDAGDILMHMEEPIYEEDTAGVLKGRLSRIGARLLVETLDLLEEGPVEPVPQEEEKATYAPPLAKGEGEIDWSRPGEKIDRLVRALNPEPGAYTFFRGKRVKIWRVRVTDVPPENDPGTIMGMGKEGFLVNTGSTCLQVLTLQPEGKPRMSAGEFSRGARLLLAERFGRNG